MEFPGFIGGAYEAANVLQDTQRLINWFVELDKNDGAKTPKALLASPGLIDLGQSVYTGPVRGMWALPGGQKGIVVVGNTVLVMQVSVAGTATTRPKFIYTPIGAINTNAGPVKIRDNGSGNVVVIVDGNSLYSYNMLTGAFYQSGDPGWLGSNTVAEIDGWFIFQQPNTQKFYLSPNYWNGQSAFDATYYALKDNFSDNLVAVTEQNRELWLLGESTTEIWYNAGGQYFPFSRLQGTLQQVGCAAAQSVSRYGSGLVWLGRSERGGYAVVITKGYQYITLVNPAFSYQIGQYPVVNDAIGYVYTEEGHEFYVLTFPTANVTWVYDFSTELWHQRASYDKVNGKFNRARQNSSMVLQGMQIVGDYTTGSVYWQTRTAYVDGPSPLVSLRRAPHIWDGGDRNRMRHNRLQVEFVPGFASSGVSPQAMLKWSDDGGLTFGNEHWASIGLTGQTRNRCIWRRLGLARDRVYELRVSDAVRRDIVGATLLAEPMGA